MKRKVMAIVFGISLVVLAWMLLPFGERQFYWNPNTLFLPDDDEPFGSELFDKMAAATLPNGYAYHQGSLDDLLDSGEHRSLLLVCGTVAWDSMAIERVDSFVRQGNKLMVVCENFYTSNDKDWTALYQTRNYFDIGILREVLKGHRPPDTLYCTNGDRIPVPATLLSSSVGMNKHSTSTSTIGQPLSKKELQRRRRQQLGAVRYVFGSDTVMVSDPYETDSSLMMDYNSQEDFEAAVRSARESLNEYLHEDVSNDDLSKVIPVGKGKVYLVGSPLLFTNYGVLDTHISRFLGWQLSQIADRPVVRFSHALVNRRGETHIVSGSSSSPLYYMLGRQPLRWAVYTMLAAIVLFMLFTARRRQRRIPVVSPPRNRNLSFVQLLGTIYYRRHDNADLLRKKYTYFREELRRSMLLDISDTTEREAHQARLAQKTGLGEAYIAETLDMVARLTAEGSTVSDRQLQECIDRMNKITTTT